MKDRVKLVFVTTDPARDTAAVLRRWLDLFDSRFIGPTAGNIYFADVYNNVVRVLRPNQPGSRP